MSRGVGRREQGTGVRDQSAPKIGGEDFTKILAYREFEILARGSMVTGTLSINTTYCGFARQPRKELVFRVRAEFPG